MTNNETQRLARKWVQKTNPKGDRETLAAIEQILATTDPLTMADVEWDHDKYALTGATLDYGHGPTDVVMLDKDGDGFINYITADKHDYGDASPSTLTPNGKRYELREVGAPEQPAHPETLVTEQDYENAPAGTVVAEPGRPALTKTHGGEWHRYGGWFTSDEMAHTERQVLRWGKHEDTSEPTVSLDENVGPDQPEHPETLVTVGDYENAPEGTIVARDDHAPLLKRGPNAWTTEYSSLAYDEDMARNPRQVLRWGWGK